jgi:phosphate transport system permease protein
MSTKSIQSQPDLRAAAGARPDLKGQVPGAGAAPGARLPREPMGDTVFRKCMLLSAVVMLALLGAMFVTLLLESLPALRANGLGFFVNTVWDPVFKEFGAVVFLVGTLLTSFLALVISIPFSLAVALYLGEYVREGIIAALLKSAIELLAGIPSVIFGLWALFVLVPLMQSLAISIGVVPYGVSILTASLILAVMIIPYSASIASDVIRMVPAELKEAALSLGATRFEMIKMVVLPYTRSGVCAGTLLALGRAIGETMAVTMVIGNANVLPANIFSPSNTMASVIANEFSEAIDSIHVASLVEIALLLMLVTLVINLIGSYSIKKMMVEH